MVMNQNFAHALPEPKPGLDLPAQKQILSLAAKMVATSCLSPCVAGFRAREPRGKKPRPGDRTGTSLVCKTDAARVRSKSLTRCGSTCAVFLRLKRHTTRQLDLAWRVP